MSKSPITQRIDSLLKLKKISKTQFYSDCDISSAAYSLWNQQKTSPSMKNLTKIAQYLSVNVGYLLDGGELDADAVSKETTISRINLLLSEKGITGAELSRDLGLSSATYSQWNTGKTSPSYRTLNQIADYFEVSIEYLKCETDIRRKKEKPTVKDDGLTAKQAEAIQLIRTMSDKQLMQFIKFGKIMVEGGDDE